MMSPQRRSLATVTAAIILSVLCANAVATVDDNCLQCICEAASKCDLSTKCEWLHGGYYCGPFDISWGFWSEGGELTVDYLSPGSSPWETCALNYDCAAATVRGYMSVFAQDCDGDGRVTCIDYLKLHKYGKAGCLNPLRDELYTQQYYQCAKRLNVY